MSPVPKQSRLEELEKAQLNRPSAWSGLNVYILGFDSLSQMAFRRNLPLTTNYLENVMGSAVINGICNLL